MALKTYLYYLPNGWVSNPQSSLRLWLMVWPGDTKGDLLFDWFGLVYFANKKTLLSCHTAYSTPVKMTFDMLPPDKMVLSQMQ
jgi:hypothetical protein